jgi:hypothetical protein
MSTRCVFLDYSADHKGYLCLDLSTNCLIVSRHMVFDEDSFSLNASPSLTDLDFLGESGSKVSTIGTRLTTVGTSIPAPRRTAPEIPPGFELPVAPLPVLTFPPRIPAPGGHHYYATCGPSGASRWATRGSDCATRRLSTCACLTSSIAYVWRPRQPAPASTTPPLSSAPFRGRSGCGGACHAPRESTSDDHTGQDWFQGGA